MPQDLLVAKRLVDHYLEETLGQLAAYSFVNIFVWQDFFQFYFEEIDGNLCIFASEQAGTFLYLPPLGKKLSHEAVKECFARMQKINKNKGVTRIDNVCEEQLRYFPANDYQITLKGYEYLYYRKDLATLKGGAYKSKRNAYNRFMKDFSVAFYPYEESLAAECMRLYEGWEKIKRLTLNDDASLLMLEDSRIIHQRVLEFFQSLGLVGRVVKIDGKVVAYTFGYFLGEGIFCDLLEIADQKYKGLATYIFIRVCDDPVLRGVKFINVMDDFSLENVKRTKMSFRPNVMLPVYTVSPLR